MNAPKSYRIAYLTSSDPCKKSNWSGTHYFMHKALQKHCGDVTVLGPVKIYFSFIFEFFNKFLHFMVGWRYNTGHNSIMAYFYGWIFSKKLRKHNFDLIFAPVSSTEISRISTKIPIIYASDATYQVLKNYYPNFKSILPFSSLEINLSERNAMHNASIILYPSYWAANSCTGYYKIPENKVSVIPYGANLDTLPLSCHDVLPKQTEECNLLLLGVSWERKGGEIAFDALMKLRALGINAKLTICGCIPPLAFQNDWTNVVPFLNKDIYEEENGLKKLLGKANFLIFPTRAECFGIVCCEANAYGTPVIACNTGGVSEAVKDNVNGYLLPYTAKGSDYAEIIFKIFEDKTKYHQLCKDARQYYETRLNWDSWAQDVKYLMDELIVKKRK